MADARQLVARTCPQPTGDIPEVRHIDTPLLPISKPVNKAHPVRDGGLHLSVYCTHPCGFGGYFADRHGSGSFVLRKGGGRSCLARARFKHSNELLPSVAPIILHSEIRIDETMKSSNSMGDYRFVLTTDDPSHSFCSVLLGSCIGLVKRSFARWRSAAMERKLPLSPDLVLLASLENAPIGPASTTLPA